MSTYFANAQPCIKLDGETEAVSVHAWGRLQCLRAGNREWYVAESREVAGEAAREYWADMAANDPTEFACIVGEETLIQWGMGHYAGPGSTSVKSLGDWLDLWLDTPEEQWASYDGAEIDVEIPEGFDVDQDYTGQEAVQAAQARIEEAQDAQAAPENDGRCDVEPSAADLYLVGFAALCEELGFVPRVAYRHN